VRSSSLLLVYCHVYNYAEHDTIVDFLSTYHTLELHPFNSLFSRTTWVSWYEKGRSILDFTEARDDGLEVSSAGPYANHLCFVPDR